MPMGPAPAALRRLFDATMIEAVFLVEDVAFNAARLRQRVWR